MKKLPIGLQTFEKIIKEDYLYIDKTDIALELIENYSYSFLSRPRRFGKSLFLDTLKNIFEGKKELFEGLYIYDKWDWDKKYPVIKLVFNFECLILNEFEEKIIEEINKNAERLDISLEQKSSSIMFGSLIYKIYKKYNKQVVILIDDWDIHLRNNLFDKNIKEFHNLLLAIYITTKDYDEYIKFAFATGIHPIKSSMLYGFNNFTDISLTPKYGNICGFTEEELKQFNIQNSTLKIKYNGYNFLKDPVYNPFDTLQFIENEFLYKNYWFESGTPTFLIKLIEKNNYFLPKLSNVVVGEELLASFDIENINLEILLYQSGYLTIESKKEKRRGGFEYKLKLPNIEVKQSFNDILIDFLTNQSTEKYQIQDNLYDGIVDNDLGLFESALKSVFASIPYNNYTNNKIAKAEGFYASVVYVYLQSLGFEIIGEDVTNKGRMDLTIKLSDKIYIIEFKVGDEDALQQIKDKKYVEKYLNENKDIYLVGINFDEKEKNINKFEWEKIK